ncbi:hypothetical protein [Streptomyces erythrochromogenes]|uniref:hypothetical protein n=1 Tax=Streptomyces erythrochromogenes TaxID=285574 RepID=UPI0036BB5299
MATLNGRPVLTRKELADAYEVSITHLEKLYRQRELNGHPEAAGTISRALVWDAADWHQWYESHTDTIGLESRTDLQDRTGLGLSTLALLWKERETNHHPEPEKIIGNTMYWNPATWDTWYQSYKANQQWRTTVDHSGNANDLISLAEAARVLGMEPTNITKYPVRPPKYWPAPAEETTTPKGFIKRKYRRGDIWTYAEHRERGGGRPAGPKTDRRYPYDGDPRLDQARTVLKANPETPATHLAGQLAQEHGGTAGTWSHIIRSAQQHPEN